MRRTVSLSPWSLDIARDPLRLPPRPYCIRGETYEEAFDFATVFCDCFWDAAGRNLILVGPPLLNLASDLDMRMLALPSGEPCPFTIHDLDRLTRTVVHPPPGATGLKIRSTAGEAILAPQPNLSDIFAGRRVLLTMSKNNEIQWIRDWVQFYVHHHGCDAVLLYDNNSDRYSVGELSAELSDTFPELQCLVIGWPFPYGVFDGRSFPGYGIWDSVYCQLVMFEHARLRTLWSARSVANVDVDELVLTPSGKGLFSLVEESLTGHMVFSGVWVERVRRGHPPAQRPPRHKDFYFVDRRGLDITEPKWAVVPGRSPAEVQWVVNSILGMPASPDTGEATIRHFKGINTNWAVDRAFAEAPRTALAPASESHLTADEDLRRAVVTAARGLNRRQARRQRVPSRRSERQAAHAQFAAARKAERAGHRQEAVSLVEQAVSRLPDHPGMLNWLADLVSRTEPDRSQDLKRKAEGLQASDAWFNVQRGRWLADRGEVAAALAHFDRAIALEPRLFHPYHFAYRALSEGGAHARALGYLERYQSVSPRDPLARVIVAEALGLRCQFGRAVEHLEAAISIDPELPHPYLQLGRCLATLGQLDAAQSALEQGIRRLETYRGPLRFSSPLTVRRTAGLALLPAAFHIVLGDVLAHKLEFSEAAACYRRGIALGPDGAECWMKLADVLARSGRPKEASTALDTALSVARTAVKNCSSIVWWGPRVQQRQLDRAWLKLCAVLLKLARQAEAVDALEQRMALSPDNPALLSQLARLKAGAGQFDEAESLLARAVEIEPENGDLHVARAQTIVGRDPERAAEAALAAIRLEPANVLLVSTAAEVLMAAGRGEEAVAALRRMVEEEPRHAPLRLRLSRALTRLGRAEEAMRHAEVAVDINPYAPDPAQHLVSLYLQSDRLNEAEAALARALRCCPTNPTAHFLLSRVHRRRGRLDEAVAAALKAMALGLDRPYVRLHAAEVLMHMQRGEEAVEILRQGIEREPSHAGLNFQLSQCLHSLGLRPEEALAAAKRAVDLSPGRAEYQVHLERLSAEFAGSG